MEDKLKEQVPTENIIADTDFDKKKQDAKKDFNKAANLYRSYVGEAETWEERKRRINRFRCG